MNFCAVLVDFNPDFPHSIVLSDSHQVKKKKATSLMLAEHSLL